MIKHDEYMNRTSALATQAVTENYTNRLDKQTCGVGQTPTLSKPNISKPIFIKRVKHIYKLTL
jgi:hypothetical protein